MKEMETLLLVWINEKQMVGDSVSEAIICEKAKQLFEKCDAKAHSTSTGPVKEFFGTKGWYTRFRKRTGEEPSFLLILGDCPVGGSSVGGRLSTFLKNESRFDCFILDFWTLQKWTIKVSLK